MLNLGQSNFNALVSVPGAFPISLKKDRGGVLSATKDLRQSIVQALLQDGVLSFPEFDAMRTLLRNMSVSEAVTFLRSAGIGETSAKLIAKEFTSDLPPSLKDFEEKSYKERVGKATLLKLTFQRNADQWELTSESQENLALPWHPKAIQPLTPVGGRTEQGKLTLSTSISAFKFASGLTKPASRISVTFRGSSMSLVIADELIASDWSLLDRIEMALSVVPAKHVALIRELVIDPGNDPGGFAIANASRDGTVNMFLNGAGQQVPQANLNETAAHEVGHLVSFQAEKKDASFWSQWDSAIESDRIGVSRYGLTDHLEDFAEAYVLYLSGGSTNAPTRARYSHRFALLDKLF